MEDIVRVIRIIEYYGPRSWVEKTVYNSIHGTKEIPLTSEARITAATLGEYPEILQKGKANINELNTDTKNTAEN